MGWQGEGEQEWKKALVYSIMPHLCKTPQHYHVLPPYPILFPWACLPLALPRHTRASPWLPARPGAQHCTLALDISRNYHLGISEGGERLT